MKDDCDACEHTEVCKYKEAYKAINAAAKSLCSKEENKNGAFTITTSCRHCRRNDTYLK
ncbi:MAG: hypothetical protein IKD01_02625 [Oscillospiraceae bacterium]|nr:hypothetical protein [Oscillospiraceae bacterium]